MSTKKTKCDITEMEKEVSKLKFQIGGFKVSNANYKKQIMELKEKLEDCDEQKKKLVSQLDEKEKVLYGLRSQVTELSECLKNVKDDRELYKANYEHFLSLPWYKRIFAK